VALEVLKEDARFMVENVVETGVVVWDPVVRQVSARKFPKDGEQFLHALLNQTGMTYYEYKVESEGAWPHPLAGGFQRIVGRCQGG
jgi:hypothetical protein